MDDNLQTIANQSLELTLEIFALSKKTSTDNAQIICEALSCDTAVFQDCWGHILSADERESVEALRKAYQKIAAIKYLLTVIEMALLLPSSDVHPLLNKTKVIETALESYIKMHEDDYEEENDDELSDALSDFIESYFTDDDSLELLDE
ncbi:MAG: hypothetical protein IJH07_06760 [Ruminococcus sp.]|nr:hypothetical protein [Ruminococcus sp.]